MVKQLLLRLVPTLAPNSHSLLRHSSISVKPRSIFSSTVKMTAEHYTFGPYKIDQSEVFYSTNLSYAMVNLRPLLPGHILFMSINNSVLVWDDYSIIVVAPAQSAGGVVACYINVLICPKREVKRFVDLTADETSDLWLTAQKVGTQLENYHKASSLTFAIQDGPQAGQTVPHVHIHVVPRIGGDFEKNDEIYDVMDQKEKELKQKLDLDKERKDRSFGEMAREADEYKKLFL